MTLTTGAPLWLNAGGATADFASTSGFAFDVRSGRVTVGPLGVAAPNRLDLIGETLSIDGSVTAGDTLNLIAGRQRVEHESLLVSDNGAQNSAAAIQASSGAVRAIDASAFGAMTAGQIRILSTAQGMGVRSAANLSATTAGITLSANGDLEIADASSAGTMQLNAQRDIVTRGAVAAADIALSTPGAWRHSGMLDSRGAITIDAGTVALDGALTSGAALSIQSSSMSSSAASTTLSAGEVRIAAANATLAGTLVGEANIAFDAGTLTHSGVTQAGGDIRIQGGNISNRGTLNADRGLALNAAALNNAGGQIQAQDLALTLTGSLDNSGARLIARNDLSVTAASLINDRAAPSVTLSQTQVYDAALLNALVVGTRDCGPNCSGVPLTLGQLSPNYANLTIGSTGVRLPLVDQIITGEREAAQGHIVAARNADIRLTGALSNRGSTIEPGERLAIRAQSLDQSARAPVRRTVSEQVNAAELARMGAELMRFKSFLGLASIAPQAAARSSVQSVDGTLGQLLSGSALDLSLDSFTNVGAVRSLGDLRVSVGNAWVNHGSVVAQRDLAVTAGSLNNERGQLLAGRDGTIAVAGALINDAGIIESGRDLSIEAGSLTNRRGPLTTRHVNYGDAAPPTRSTAATSTVTASRPSRSNRAARGRSMPRATWH